jgi:serine/threonine protein kinase
MFLSYNSPLVDVSVAFVESKMAAQCSSAGGTSAHEVLEQMAQHVRQGQFDDAACCGNAYTIPLAVPGPSLVSGPELGTGSESVIRAGQLNGTPVAIKKAVIRNTADLDRFRREVSLLCSLSHTNIVPLLAARVLPPNYTMVLPRYSGSIEVRYSIFAIVPRFTRSLPGQQWAVMNCRPTVDYCCIAAS